MPRTATSSTSSAPSLAEIPFVRRRLLPEQVAALQSLYETKTHPSKEERAALAAELGLELKSVNVWYQNKRRSVKKQALIWKPEKEQVETQSYRSKRRDSSPRRLGAPSFSLDSIATSRERKDTLILCKPRPPLTPRRNKKAKSSPTSPFPQPNLWDFIPSSPHAPPSSPSAESVRFSVLPPESKSRRSLEFACAKARANKKHHRRSPIVDPPLVTRTSVELEGLVADDGEHTEPEPDEAITPENSLVGITGYLTPPRRGAMVETPRKETPSKPEDVAAAITLLGFKVRN